MSESIRPCGTPDVEYSDEFVELDVRIVFYKKREIRSEGNPHMVSLRCVGKNPPPLLLQPLDENFIQEGRSLEDRVRHWAEVRATISTALALADAQFLELYPAPARPARDEL